jgi:hypothetical protein
MGSWFDRIKERFSGQTGEAPESPGPLSATDWTIPGITFDTTGWQLEEASASRMLWKAPNGVLTLTPVDPSSDQLATLTDLRHRYRAAARAGGEDIVAVEVLPARGGEVLQIIYKRPVGRGYGFRGVLGLRGSKGAFRIESDLGEGGWTGTREAMVNGMRVSCGEFAIGPIGPDGSARILGLLHDPYDPAFDEEALNSVSDDERLDPIMPGHPLSRTRALLDTVRASLDLAGLLSPVIKEDPPAPARRQELSFPVLMAIYEAARRPDLGEPALQERIAMLGDTPSPQLAGCLMQLGRLLRMRGRAGNAVPLLSRAERMFIELAGLDAKETVIARTHHAYALVEIGRHRQALPMFISAIKVFEKERFDDRIYLLALAGAGHGLSEQGDTVGAAEYIGRALQLQEAMKQEPTQ